MSSTAGIISEELKRMGWKEDELAKRPKIDRAKLAMAERLRKETTLPIKWIADRLRMGTRASVNTRLQEWKRERTSGCTKDNVMV